MDFYFLKDFFVNYSLPTVTIAIAVAVLSVILNKFLTHKMPVSTRNYLSFLLSILLYFAYDMIFVKNAFVFSADAFYAGVLSGSLSTIIFTAICRIAQGKTVGFSATCLLIEGLIKGHVEDGALTATALALEKLFTQSSDDNVIEEVKQILAVNSSLTEEETEGVAKLIIDAVYSLKNS